MTRLEVPENSASPKTSYCDTRSKKTRAATWGRLALLWRGENETLDDALKQGSVALDPTPVATAIKNNAHPGCQDHSRS